MKIKFFAQQPLLCKKTDVKIGLTYRISVFRIGNGCVGISLKNVTLV